MRILKETNLEMLKLLKRISRASKFPQVRNRAQCIILSYQGFSTEQLMTIFGISRRTLYNWLTRWEKSGFVGLYNEKGRGRKSKLSRSQIAQVKEWVKAEPKRFNKVVIKIHQEWGVKVSKETIKRMIKKLNMIWKRMKRGLSKTPSEWELEVKMPELLKLKEQDKQGEIDLRYLDESGFCLKPYLPYAWQEKNSTIILRSSQSKRINVLGLMNRRQELFYEIHSRTIESETVISFLDKFSKTITKPTVVVLDQASIHTSDGFLSKLPEWEQKNLKIFWLPPYSPQQNLIEILWKFIKYEWIEIEAYASWSNLIKYLKKVLDNFGQEYAINFV